MSRFQTASPKKAESPDSASADKTDDSGRQRENELIAVASFAGVMQGFNQWARMVWKKNPQLLGYYKTKRLAWIAKQLELFETDSLYRASCGIGDFSIYPYDRESGKFSSEPVYAFSKEELQEYLLFEARSFVPDADDNSRAMEDFFTNYGKNWWFRGLPECWQEFDECCDNPGYQENTLRWDA